MTDDAQTTTMTSRRTAFRQGYLKAQADALDRCRLEMRRDDTVGNSAIARCLDAVAALDVWHADAERLAAIVREATNNDR